jgi:hypothetical protein
VKPRDDVWRLVYIGTVGGGQAGTAKEDMYCTLWYRFNTGCLTGFQCWSQPDPDPIARSPCHASRPPSHIFDMRPAFKRPPPSIGMVTPFLCTLGGKLLLGSKDKAVYGVLTPKRPQVSTGKP